MFDCFTSSHSVYFEEAFDFDFWKQYKGVVVNAHNQAGYGHFAIRKPRTFWFDLPKFVRKMFPYKWIMWKKEKEKMGQMEFWDDENAIEIFGDIENSSCRKLTFDKETYDDLRACIPTFLEHVGYKFQVIDQGSHLSLVFEYDDEYDD